MLTHQNHAIKEGGREEGGKPKDPFFHKVGGDGWRGAKFAHTILEQLLKTDIQILSTSWNYRVNPLPPSSGARTFLPPPLLPFAESFFMVECTSKS